MATNHYYILESPTTLESIEDRNDTGDCLHANETSNNSSIHNENERSNNINRNIMDTVAFCKSQAALNAAYKQRRAKYYQTPIAARIVTGKNLKNLQPLAVRSAEFC